LFLTTLTAATSYLEFNALGLHPVAVDLGFFQIRWYSLAYITGIIIGWWYLLKLLAQPGAPMARRHADDLVFYATLGIILGGRIAYIAFYDPEIMRHPLDALKLWNGGMSFHGGMIGVTVALILLARKEKLNWLRIHDYVACCVPFGLFFGRLANFVNGELYGRVTDVAWAIRFPEVVQGILITGPPRHPSQLYEAALEGIALFLVMAIMFWKTQARYEPGKLVGTFLLGYGLARFTVEFFRQPDSQLADFAFQSGMSMGQWLTVPMIVGGLYLVVTAKGRRRRIEAVAGTKSVA